MTKADDVTIVVELLGDFASDVLDTLETMDPEGQIDFAFGTGLGAERVLKFISDNSKSALRILKKFAVNATQANRVTGVKITKDGVEVGAMHADDTEKIKIFVEDILGKLDGR